VSGQAIPCYFLSWGGEDVKVCAQPDITSLWFLNALTILWPHTESPSEGFAEFAATVVAFFVKVF
jgi:hypothetical protein